ncbi:MAG: VWA domain-containing protein [bacterium]|nr:VWA domain-containing protein [bacterium]
MRFAVEAWLWLLLLPPALWALMRWSDGRARADLARLLGRRAGEHVEGRPVTALVWRRFFLLTGLCWLVLALARPQWGTHEIEMRQRGTDVVIALDVSNSMLAQDVVPSRMARAKAELAGFLDDYGQGRVGLVLFAGQSFVQCPLTLDRGTAQLFLRMADTDMISTQGTAIASALETSGKLLVGGRGQGTDGARQAILLVTDGEDLEGGWREAAATCREQGIVIVPVGVGEESGGLVPDPDREGFSEGRSGQRRDEPSGPRRAPGAGGLGTGHRVPHRPRGTRPSRPARRDRPPRGARPRRPSGRAVRGTLRLAAGVGPDQPVAGHAGAPAPADRRRRFGPAADSGCAGGPGRGLGPAGRHGRPPGARPVPRRRLRRRAARLRDRARRSARRSPTESGRGAKPLARLGRHEEAEREFARALSQSTDPDLRAESLYNSGTNALSAGDAQRAVEQLRRSLDLDPAQRDALHNLELAVRSLEQPPPEPQQDQEQEQQEQQQQQQEQQQQQQQQQQEQQEQQEQQQQQEQDQPEQSQEPQQAQPQTGEPDQEQLSRERALSILKGLDRDEEELRRAVQKRLQGEGNRSGKRW